jgi:hypothetical protein
MYFREPFLSDVFEGGRGSDGEADKKDVGLGIREWAQTVVIFLSGCIEETQGVWLITDPVDRY